MRVHVWFRRIATILPLTLLVCLPLAGCEDNQAPQLPTRIEIVTGDAQYSKRGTELPVPLRVRVRFDNGTPAGGYNVSFRVVELSGTLSATTDRANDGGLAVTTLTLPDAVGTVRVRASLEGSADVYVDFTATSSNYYCPQEDPLFARSFTNQGNLFLFTNKSSLFPGAGLVKIVRGLGKFDATMVAEITSASQTDAVPWDAAFSASGDFFVATTRDKDDIVQIMPDLSYGDAGFATLESYLGSEITATPSGILVGCDDSGPFSVGCRDTLARWDDALYDGVSLVANDDAVAADPVGGDIYYIVSAPGGASGAVMRLPVASGVPETVVDLTADEALGAKGMEVDAGNVYILVNRPTVKSLLKVTAAGAKSTEIDFFAVRGAGDAAGSQSDLALDRQNHFLYTVDTLHGTLLLYSINSLEFVELVPNTPNTDAEALSKASSNGQERVGLVVLP